MISEVRRGRSSGAASRGKESEAWSLKTVKLSLDKSQPGGTVGQLTPDLGKNANIEVAVYGKPSIYAKNQILKYSTDPLARSIAAQELLELLNVVIPDPAPTESAMGTTAEKTVNSTITGASATSGTFVQTS